MIKERVLNPDRRQERRCGAHETQTGDWERRGEKEEEEARTGTGTGTGPHPHRMHGGQRACPRGPGSDRSMWSSGVPQRQRHANVPMPTPSVPIHGGLGAGAGGPTGRASSQRQAWIEERGEEGIS